MEQGIPAEDRAAWLAAAANAGLTMDDSADELIEKARGLGIDLDGLFSHDQDTSGTEHDQQRMNSGEHGLGHIDFGQLLTTETVEDAIRMVMGEALVRRMQAEATQGDE